MERTGIRVLALVMNHPDDVGTLGEGREEGLVGVFHPDDVEGTVDLVRRYAEDWDFVGSEWRLAGENRAFELLLTFRRERQSRRRDDAREQRAREVDAAVSR